MDPTLKVFYVLTVVIATVDLVLFLMPYFDSDVAVIDGQSKDAPLPKNDFRRMINFFQSPGFVPQVPPQQQSKTCSCDAKREGSKNVECKVGKHGQMRTHMLTRIKDMKFNCAFIGNRSKTTGMKTHCQCCDCGTEEKKLTFTSHDIYKYGICPECEKPVITGSYNSTATYLQSGIANAGNGNVHFTRGEVYQMMFRLPLGVKHDYTALSMDIVVEGNFTHSYDNDLMIGFIDGASTAWVAQRGDNGIWFSIGKYLKDKNETVGKFHPSSLGFEPRGSRASRYQVRITQTNQGRGRTTISMDNNLDDSGGVFHKVGTWTKSGWKTTGIGSDLHLVAFRDDDNEVYEINKVHVIYKKLQAE